MVVTDLFYSVRVMFMNHDAPCAHESRVWEATVNNHVGCAGQARQMKRLMEQEKGKKSCLLCMHEGMLCTHWTKRDIPRELRPFF